MPEEPQVRLVDILTALARGREIPPVVELQIKTVIAILRLPESIPVSIVREMVESLQFLMLDPALDSGPSADA